MGYGKRIDTLCSLLTPAKVFADIGCDHGYCSEYMLKNSLCERAVLSDISKGSLKKAELLLAGYIKDGRAKAVLGDGFFGVDESVDEVLIAGMGGHEIVHILSDEKYGFLPRVFVFQPMQGADRLRRYLIGAGAFLERDFTFRDGKFYDVIRGRRRKDGEPVQDYSELEYEFGRENLRVRSLEFLQRTEKQLKNVLLYLSDPALQAGSREALEKRKRSLEKVLNNETE